MRCNGVFLLLPLIMYFPRILPGVETQPLLLLFFSLLYLAIGPRNAPRVSFLILLVTVLILIVLPLAEGLIGSPSIRMLQLLIGPLFFLGAVAANAVPPSRFLLGSVTLLLTAIMLLELLAPSLYKTIASALLERANVADGHRGVSLLTPEPTYAAISLTYLFLLTLWARPAEKRTSYWIEVLQFVLILATLSTYAVIIIATLLAGRFPKIALVGVGAALFTIPALQFVPLGNTENIRVVVALSRLLASDFSDLLPTLSHLDASLGSRLVGNAASFKTLTFAPLGLGLGCEALPTAFEKLRYIFAFKNEVIAQVVEEGCLKPQSYGATVFLGLGFGAFIYIAALVFCFRLSFATLERSRLWLPAFAVTLMMFVVQAQLSSPIPWMILFLAVARPGRISEHRSVVDIRTVQMPT